jgi:UDP-glucuronate 4-epimerase
MNVLVTGGAGFIGSHFIERLLARERHARVVCLDDFNDYYDPALKRANVARLAGERVKVVEGSICDEMLVGDLFRDERFAHVVHLGGYAGVRTSLEQPLVYERANVRGTLVLLEAARRCPVQRFTFASSSTVYGAGSAVPFVDDAPLGVPLSPYGVTKQAAELFVQHYHRVHGVPTVSVRPFSVYGPRMRPDLAIHVFATAITAGRPIPLFGDGSYLRDFTHVSDVCEGLLATLTAEGAVGEAINLGHHEPIAMLELIRLLESELGAQAKIDFRPAFAGDMPVTCAELSKAARLLGYHPQVSIADGVRDFVHWFAKR